MFELRDRDGMIEIATLSLPIGLLSPLDEIQDKQ